MDRARPLAAYAPAEPVEEPPAEPRAGTRLALAVMLVD